ncbi:MAG: SLBB domain-containing protein [Bacteroidota bacterium]
MIAYSLHKVNALRALFLTVAFVLAASLAWSQSLADIQNVKVDNLSNAQIEQLVKRAEANGINSSQLVALAQERGMPPSEAAKLGRRISELMNGNASQGQVMGSRQGRNLMSEPQVDVFDSLRRCDPYYDLTPEQKKIFGFKLFHNRQLDFSPSLNLPTPLSYIIGAGDQLLIDIYGASQQAYDLTVSPEGRIFIPNLGPIQVGGASVEAATARLKTSLGRIYSSLLGSSPSSFLQLRLGNIRSIKVSMVGEVVKPGTYTLPSFASVFNALYAAGGPNENGAFRTIQVYRNSRLEATVDIYDFLSKGDQSSNITLQDNDVIIVPPFQSRVELVGPVRREGYFEVKPGESLADLYQFAGGFSSKAFRDRVTVRRFDQDRRKVIDVASDQYEVFVPQDGDEILVGEVLDRFTNRVQVVGSVNREGEFSLEDGMTISELIEKAEGLRPEAFLSRATLYRTNTDLTLGALPIDLSGILEGNAVDVELKNEDLLFIPNRYDIQEEYYVKISGEVNFPGTYPFASQMTVGDLILRSGGLLESAANSSIEIARRVRDATSGRIAEISTLTIDPNLKLSPEEEVLPLSPFDHVFIRRSPGFEREQLISVRGEVIYPGEFVIQNANERISDLINRAGGLSQFAYPKGANLIRRTVYYEAKSEDELREESLKQLWDRLNPETNRNLNEAERMLFERVDKKLTDLEEEKKAKRLEESSMDQVMVFSDTLSIDPDLNQARFKTEDLVGINLEFIMKNPGSEADLILMEGDILQVPKQLQTVRMVGEVLLPTTARYEKGRTLKYYISKAGGFTENARKGKAYVVYANGDAAQTRGFLGIKNYPSIEPGAEIVIPQKPQRERMNAAGWIGIASSLATLGILVERLFSN